MRSKPFLSIAYLLVLSVAAASLAGAHVHDPVEDNASQQSPAVETIENDGDVQETTSAALPSTTAVDNDQSENGSYGPWTHKPVCTDFLEELGSELCVYTNATFSQGRGISIFTTPRIAEEYATLLPFHDPEALSSRGINIPNGVWYTKDIPGKGVGMLAKRDLQRGDLITAFTPYLLSHTENILSTEEREKFLQIALSQLPIESQEHYLGLAKIYHIPSVVVQDVCKANSFEMQVGGQMHLAVFPETSRINHACAPNAQYYLDADLLTHVVHAVRPIAKDEEITISYSTPYEPFSVRQEYLQHAFKFTCTCSRCQQGEGPDAGLVEIHNLQQSLGNWEADSKASVKQAERLIKVYEQEGLDGFLDNAYGHAALMYNSVGSVRGTKKYARLAAEAAALKQGPHSSDVNVWLGLMEDPMSHSSWRRRKIDREL